MDIDQPERPWQQQDHHEPTGVKEDDDSMAPQTGSGAELSIKLDQEQDHAQHKPQPDRADKLESDQVEAEPQALEHHGDGTDGYDEE
jgi:hypothetical protein